MSCQKDTRSLIKISIMSTVPLCLVRIVITVGLLVFVLMRLGLLTEWRPKNCLLSCRFSQDELTELVTAVMALEHGRTGKPRIHSALRMLPSLWISYWIVVASLSANDRVRSAIG